GRLNTSCLFLIGNIRRGRYYMAETKRLITINRIVYSTEEFSALKQAADRAGARIIRTTSSRDGAGINVELEMQGSKRNCSRRPLSLSESVRHLFCVVRSDLKDVPNINAGDRPPNANFDAYIIGRNTVQIRYNKNNTNRPCFFG